MKFDVLIYSRGTSDGDGLALRVRPERFQDKLISGCMPFFELRSKPDERLQRIQNNDPDAWLNSFIFIIVPNGGGCMLLRSVKATDKNTGQILKDFTNRDIWSLEGIWCPEEEKEILIAVLPSVLNKFREIGRPLHNLFEVQDYQNNEKRNLSLEIDDEEIENIYSDNAGRIKELSYASFTEEKDKTAVKALIARLRSCSKPFSFSFGPFADVIMSRFARGYGLTASFPTAEAGNSQIPDDELFDSISVTKIVERQHSAVKEYKLQFGVEIPNKKEIMYSWNIVSIPASEDDPLYTGNGISEDMTEGIRYVTLCAEAEGIRAFMDDRCFITEKEPRSQGYYNFKKEE